MRLLAAAFCILLCLPVAGCDGPVGQRTADTKDSGVTAEVSTTPTVSAMPPLTPPSGAPANGGAPAAPPALVPEGKDLTTVQVAPPRTYALFDLPSPFSGAEFVLVARPFGWTRDSDEAGARRMIVRVEDVKPVKGQTSGFPDLRGQNALIWMDSGAQGLAGATVGGSYRIEVMVRPRGKTGALYAKSVARVD